MPTRREQILTALLEHMQTIAGATVRHARSLCPNAFLPPA